MNDSPFADPDAEAKGYPKRRVPPCQRRTPNQSGCRVACIGGACVYLTHGNCPWPKWGKLTHQERDDYNGTPMAHRTHRADLGTANPGHPPFDVLITDGERRRGSYGLPA